MKLTTAETQTYARLVAKMAAPEPKAPAAKKTATKPKKKAPKS